MRKLNPQQHQAVEHDRGPLLVLAGAGSGKTLVVTRRVARLVERGTPPHAILAMTFTNKAAGEMHERVTQLVGKAATKLTISTFHSFGLQVLKAEARNLGMRDGRFAIFDQADQASTVREILRNIFADKRYDVWAILTRISKAKNDFVEPDKFESREGDEYDEITQLVYPKYVEALKAFRAFDFDDLICEVVHLFRRREDVLARWRNRFWYLLVDEYQDTNHAQFELVRCLAEEHRNVCVVGDDDQSIYAWRGADVSNILDFERHFPGTKVVKLQSNYRSSASILAVANAVIAASGGKRHSKELVATQEMGDKVQLIEAMDSDVEAAFVAQEIRRSVDEGMALRNIAVLYRSNNQAQPIEEALRAREIAYRMVGGTQFFERKEVKDLLAYLRVAVQPHDEIALRRIINYPARGIGQVALERLSSHAIANDITLWKAVERASSIRGMTAHAVAGCAALFKVVEQARERIEAKDLVADVARDISVAVALEADIIVGSGSNEVAARRRGNLEATYRMLERHDKKDVPGPDSLSQLLRVLSLQLGDDDEDKDPGNLVTLTTVHGAKGLEFDTVFIVGTEEGYIPHARTLDTRATDVDPQDIEEERRLFYVAITRAKRRLFICRSKHRAMRGKMVPRTPSRFLSNIPAELVETHEVREEAAPTRRAMLDGVAGLLAMLEQS